jgi:hypothetical protein
VPPSSSLDLAAAAGGDEDDGRPVLPRYGGPCLSSVVPALFSVLGWTDEPEGDGAEGGASRGPGAPWMPEVVAEAQQIVLLVLDGLGWLRLRRRIGELGLDTWAAATGGPITSVAPTTTATALTSIATGSVPAHHGLVSYRLRVPPEAVGGEPAPAEASSEVMNVLRWSSHRGDLRQRARAATFCRRTPFGGRSVDVVSRHGFGSTGFTAAHLGSARLWGWQVPSTLVVETARLLAAGRRFVYAYYDGLDKVAHQYGLGEHYDRELVEVDRLVADLVAVLPPGAVLVATSDHGQVEVGAATRMPSAALMETAALLSGEGRFRWLHARPGAGADLLAVATEEHGDEAWVRTREEIVAEGWLGAVPDPEVAARLGDVALVARAPVAFLDPADTGETRLQGRHGSLTAEEMLVPLVAWRR